MVNRVHFEPIQAHLRSHKHILLSFICYSLLQPKATIFKSFNIRRSGSLPVCQRNPGKNATTKRMPSQRQKYCNNVSVRFFVASGGMTPSQRHKECINVIVRFIVASGGMTPSQGHKECINVIVRFFVAPGEMTPSQG